MQLCPRCDYQNPDGIRFCGNCGAALTAPAAAQTPPAPSPFQATVTTSAPAQPSAGAPIPTLNVNVTVQSPASAPAAAPQPMFHPAPLVAPAPVVVVNNQSIGPGLLVRALYFLVVGWWLSELWILAAWLFNLTIVGLPLGLAMLNRVPQITTLKSPRKLAQVTVAGNTVVVSQGNLEQYPFLLRAVYFVCVGWWMSLAWSEVAWALSLTVIGMPLAFWMFDRVPAVTTLARI